MAALSEREMRRILGDNYEGSATDSPIAAMAKKRKDRKDTVEDRKFTAMAAVIMGAGLVVSALYTATGQAFLIQNGVAAALVVAGGIWYAAACRLERRDIPEG
jgi:hypothetical protein